MVLSSGPFVNIKVPVAVILSVGVFADTPTTVAFSVDTAGWVGLSVVEYFAVVVLFVGTVVLQCCRLFVDPVASTGAF